MFSAIQTELRKPAHYLSMRKRQQAANHIDRLEAALNQHSEDEILLTHQSTIAAQAKQIEALTDVIVNRDWIIKQLLPPPAVDIDDLVTEFEAMPGGLNEMNEARQWLRETLMQPSQPASEHSLVGWLCEWDGWNQVHLISDGDENPYEQKWDGPPPEKITELFAAIKETT